MGRAQGQSTASGASRRADAFAPVMGAERGALRPIDELAALAGAEVQQLRDDARVRRAAAGLLAEHCERVSQTREFLDSFIRERVRAGLEHPMLDAQDLAPGMRRTVTQVELTDAVSDALAAHLAGSGGVSDEELAGTLDAGVADGLARAAAGWCAQDPHNASVLLLGSAGARDLWARGLQTVGKTELSRLLKDGALGQRMWRRLVERRLDGTYAMLVELGASGRSVPDPAAPRVGRHINSTLEAADMTVFTPAFDQLRAAIADYEAF